MSFGLYCDGVLIGIALGRIKSWYTGTEYWIEEFGILREKRQGGLGAAFLQAIEKAVAEKGMMHIALLTNRKVPAYNFYQKKWL